LTCWDRDSNCSIDSSKGDAMKIPLTFGIPLPWLCCMLLKLKFWPSQGGSVSSIARGRQLSPSGLGRLVSPLPWTLKLRHPHATQIGWNMQESGALVRIKLRTRTLLKLRYNYRPFHVSR
jgi:hypothetical protein